MNSGDEEEEFTPVVIHLISDVHLEHMYMDTPTPPQTKYISVLVIAGDLGNIILQGYRDYIESAAKKYDAVIFILGNHEYHTDTTIDNTKARARKIATEISNVKFLDRNVITLFGIDWIGCTLWSDPPPGIKKAPISDFSVINGMTKMTYKAMHLEDKKWLNDVLNEDAVRPRVVITHHIPSMKVVRPEYMNRGDINRYFYSNCDDLICKADIWFCGHTHRPIMADFGNTPLLCNPRGYPHEGSEYDYNVHIAFTKSKQVKIIGYKNWYTKVH